MQTITKSLISIGILGGGASISGLIYDYIFFKPVREENKTFERLYNANEPGKPLAIETINIDKDESSETAIPKIKKGCDQKKDKSIQTRNDLIVFLNFCKGKFSTIKDLLNNGKENALIKTDEDYEVSLFFAKKQESKKEGNLKDIKEGCSSQLEKPITEADHSLLLEAGFLCRIKQINNVEEYIKRIDPNGEMTGESGLKAMHALSINNNKITELLKKYNLDLSKTPRHEKGIEEMKNGCESGINKKLTGDLQDEYIEFLTKICKGEIPIIN